MPCLRAPPSVSQVCITCDLYTSSAAGREHYLVFQTVLGDVFETSELFFEIGNV